MRCISTGVLIEAKDLVNGVSIVQAERVDKVEYFHIELDTHDVIIAEGALSETFIDDDSRGMFHNAHEYDTLYADDVAAAGVLLRAAARRRLRSRSGAAAHRAARRTCCAPPMGRSVGELRGYVDRVSATRIAGWAQNVDAPEAPVCLDIFADGQLIGQVLANGYRDDLEAGRPRQRPPRLRLHAAGGPRSLRRTRSKCAARSMRRPYAARREALPCTGGQPGVLQVNS